jgi:hypothetical protein
VGVGGAGVALGGTGVAVGGVPVGVGPPQEGNLNEPMRVRQLDALVAW